MLLLKSLFLIILSIYSLKYFSLGVLDYESMDFLHMINLGFHEGGHLIMMPFGEFIHIFGGSLFQCLAPLIFAGYFYYKEQANFSAVICLWWMGQNFTDVAIYIYDARTRSLPLINDMGPESHDWYNLLAMTDMLQYDDTIALTTHYLGMVIMAAAILWCMRLLVKEYVEGDQRKLI